MTSPIRAKYNESASETSFPNFKELERLIEEHLTNGEYETATFWAEKRLALHANKSRRPSLYEIAKFLWVQISARNWQLVITYINGNDLLLKHIIFAFFHVNALFNLEMYSEIVTLPLGHLRKWDDVPFIVPEPTSYIDSQTIIDKKEKDELDSFVEEKKFEYRLLLILAKTYLLVQNRPAAEGCLRNCIVRNPCSKEAVQLALNSKLLSSEQIRALLRQSVYSDSPALNVIRLLLDYYNPQADLNDESQPMKKALSEDLSMKAASAFRLYNDGQIEEAYKVTSQLVHKFGFYMDCFLIYVACLVELRKTNELYLMGHRLVDLHPEREITWYTVGCYYYATAQFGAAKKFLNKCTTMNPSFGEGWLAFGHALSQDKEHEQAMNCYLRASRILDGCVEPTMYIGLEHCFANNLKLAWNYIQDLSLDSNTVPNAIVLHEQGTVAFLQRDFTKAESTFKKALRVLCGIKDQYASLSTLLAGNVNEYWEPLYNNLGHTLRKLEKYPDAIEVHTKSLRMTRNKSATWSAIGVCYACMGSLNQAMDALNQALALNPHDELIRSAWERVMHRTGTDFQYNI